MKFYVCLFASFIYSGLVFADREIVVIGADNKPPKICLVGDTPKGILVDILRYVDEGLPDNHFKAKLYPFPRAYQYALQDRGGIIGLFTIAPNFLGFTKEMQMNEFLSGFNEVLIQGLLTGNIQKLLMVMTHTRNTSIS